MSVLFFFRLQQSKSRVDNFLDLWYTLTTVKEKRRIKKMTVAELIEELKKYPQDVEVFTVENDEEIPTRPETFHYYPWHNMLTI